MALSFCSDSFSSPFDLQLRKNRKPCSEIMHVNGLVIFLPFAPLPPEKFRPLKPCQFSTVLIFYCVDFLLCRFSTVSIFYWVNFLLCRFSTVSIFSISQILHHCGAKDTTQESNLVKKSSFEAEINFDTVEN